MPQEAQKLQIRFADFCASLWLNCRQNYGRFDCTAVNFAHPLAQQFNISLFPRKQRAPEFS